MNGDVGEKVEFCQVQQEKQAPVGPRRAHVVGMIKVLSFSVDARLLTATFQVG